MDVAEEWMDEDPFGLGRGEWWAEYGQVVCVCACVDA